jgi:2-hydroxy-6-oxonona-2,4-dienedioate hydrolase
MSRQLIERDGAAASDEAPSPPRTDHAPGARIEGRRTIVEGRSMFARVNRRPIDPSVPPIVLVHGLMVAGTSLRPLMRRLAPDWHVAAPDLPGFGASDKPDESLDITQLAQALGAWMDASGYDRVVLVGTSLGTQIAAEYAAARPDRIAGLVLIGPVMDPAARSVPRSMMRWLLELPQELSQLPIMVRDYVRGGLRRADATFRMMLDFRIEERLRSLTMPVLVLRGGWDPIVPDDWARSATALLADGRYRSLPRQAHAAAYTAPDDVADAIDTFMRVAVLERKEQP